ITLSVVAVTVVGRQLHIGLEGRPGR
ncbi:hypothetical protein GA0115255_109961, partial [Streptomyces sp. Ncost-T6T-2b]